MTTSPRIPVLHAGDRLTRTEFERRYLAMPGLKKAELLEGVVYMPSPVRLTFHAEPHGLLCGWLAVYAAGTPGVAHAIDATLRVDEDNEVQPDLMLRILGATGRSRVDADHHVVGAPELLVEVAASSVSYDMHQKLQVYRRAGVREYLVLRAEDAEVDWFELRDGRYEPISADRPGVLASRAFPGLCLDVPALLAGDDAALHAAVRAGLATDQHAAFAASLRR